MEHHADWMEGPLGIALILLVAVLTAVVIMVGTHREGVENTRRCPASSETAEPPACR